MERCKPVTGEIYHIYNRGVEKRKICANDTDRLLFVNGLFIFNDKAASTNTSRLSNNLFEVGLRTEKLVEILAFCLMPNHYHLMLRQLVENGITEFMRKTGTGHTNYFNIKYERVGPLFQGKYKIAPVKNEAHFIHLPYYIHLNPLDAVEPKWREGNIKNIEMAINFLESYRWSSYLDYIGKENFPLITDRNFLNDFFENPRQHRKDMIGWLKESGTEILEDIILE